MRVWNVAAVTGFGRVFAYLALCAGFAMPAQALTIEEASPLLVKQIVFATLALAAFFAAIIVWIYSALQNLRRKQRTRAAFVNSALNNMRQGLIMVAADGRLVFCNDYYLRMYKLTRADVHPRMDVRTILGIRKARGTYLGDPSRLVTREDEIDRAVHDHTDGRSIMITRHWLPNGGWVTAHEDITEQRELSRQLATTKHFLESVIDNIPVCVAVKNIQDGKYVLANRAFEQFSRFPRDKIVGSRAEDIFTPNSAAAVLKADADAVASESGHVTMDVIVERGTHKRVLTARRVVARDEKGKPEFIVALFEDTTERTALAKEVEETKKFLELVVDHIPFSVIVKSARDRDYLLVNRSAEQFMQMPRQLRRINQAAPSHEAGKHRRLWIKQRLPNRGTDAVGCNNDIRRFHVTVCEP